MLACQKPRFTLPDGLHYLNCAFMAPLAHAVRTAGIEGIDRRATPHLISAPDFFEESDHIRRLFSQLVNISDPNRVAIIPSVSYGLATVARNAHVEPGGNIVIVEEQFPSNVYTWRRLCAERNLELKVVEAPERSSGTRASAWCARLLAAINRRTAVVALPQVHWADGTLFDLTRVGDRARDCDALLVVDGTQSVGALPLDVERVQPDALVCAAYKWLLGPYSTGLAYFGPAFDHGTPIEENWITRLGSERFADLVHYRDEYQPAAIRYDVGERSNFILLPMLAAALELVLEWTAPAIQDYCRALTKDLIRTLRERGYGIEEDGWRGEHLFGIRVRDSADTARLAERLHERQVTVSLRGDAIRVAPHLYNDAADTEALLDALD
jgi:selenocysteine lyase/cysteine desulfurase